MLEQVVHIVIIVALTVKMIYVHCITQQDSVLKNKNIEIKIFKDIKILLLELSLSYMLKGVYVFPPFALCCRVLFVLCCQMF